MEVPIAIPTQNEDSIDVRDKEWNTANKRIIFRVVRMWRTHNTTNGQPMKLQFIANDIKQMVFLCSIGRDFVPLFEDRLKEGSVYRIRDFGVAKVRPLCRILHNARGYVVIDSSTQLDLITDNIPSILRHYFNLVPFNDLLQVSKGNTYLCDVIGQITMLDVIERGEAAASTFKTLHGKLSNLRGKSIDVTFGTSDSAVALNVSLQRSERICIFTSMIVTISSDGLIILSASDASRIYASFNVKEIHEFHSRYCPQCQEQRQASKKLDLWKLPEVLVIHLKRFSYNRSVKQKLETFVNFPIHDLDLTNYIANKQNSQRQLYELYALTNHYGDMASGHYTANIKLIEDNRWYNFDDSSVLAISEDKVKSSAAYVLFYRRVKNDDGDGSS